MVVNRSVLWLLMAGCCAPSVVRLIRLRLDEARGQHGRWREAPLSFAGACLDGVLTGVGVGLGAACGVLAVCALWVELF